MTVRLVNWSEWENMAFYLEDSNPSGVCTGRCRRLSEEVVGST